MKSVAPPTTYVPIPQPPPLRQRRILTLTLDQENILLNQFKKIPRAPHREDVILLAAETGLTEEEVQVSVIVFFVFFSKIFVDRSLLSSGGGDECVAPPSWGY